MSEENTKDSSTLTLRLETKEEVKALDDLKDFLGEKTGTKAIIKVIKMHVKQHREMSAEIRKQKEKIRKLSSNLDQLIEYRNSLKAFLEFKVDTTDELNLLLEEDFNRADKKFNN